MTKSEILTLEVSCIIGILVGNLIIWALWTFIPIVPILIVIGLMGYVLYAYVKAPE